MSGVLRLAAVALALVACHRGPGRADAAAPPPPRVVVESPSGRSSEVRVEVVRTPADVERGLMFRERLGADDGMLFVFPVSEEHTFWMKNTLIPLDMLFISEGGAVIGIVANAEPMTTTPRTVGKPSRYVLEVNGGWSAAHGVSAGDRVRLVGVSP